MNATSWKTKNRGKLRHKVRGFPTVVAYSHGVEIDRFQSAQTEGYLRRFIDSIIERHSAVISNPDAHAE